MLETRMEMPLLPGWCGLHLLDARAGPGSTAPSLSGERLVRRWPVERRHRLLVQPKIGRELSAMMIEVIERAESHGLVPGFVGELLAIEQQVPPGLLEPFTGRCLKGGPRLRDCLVEGAHQLVRRREGLGRVLARRSEVELVLCQHRHDPAGHDGYQPGERAERHGLLVRLPVVLPFGDALQRPSRAY